MSTLKFIDLFIFLENSKNGIIIINSYKKKKTKKTISSSES